MPVTRFRLAQGIIARFERRRGGPRRVAEVLLRRHRPMSMRRVFNVGVTLHLHRRDVNTRLHTIERRIIRAAATMPIVLRRQTPPPPPARVERMVERAVLQHVLAREIRRETLTRDRRSTVVRDVLGRPSAAAPPAPDAARPVEFILRRTAPAIDKTEREQPPAEVRADVFARAFAPAAGLPQAAPAIPLTPTELARLTDDVVRAIDRRFTAHRERRGVA
jgi:hypothetical protein